MARLEERVCGLKRKTKTSPDQNTNTVKIRKSTQKKLSFPSREDSLAMQKRKVGSLLFPFPNFVRSTRDRFPSMPKEVCAFFCALVSMRISSPMEKYDLPSGEALKALKNTSTRKSQMLNLYKIPLRNGFQSVDI